MSSLLSLLLLLLGFCTYCIDEGISFCLGNGNARRLSVALFETTNGTNEGIRPESGFIIEETQTIEHGESRRFFFQNTLLMATTVSVGHSQSSHAAETLPSTLRDYTKLAPLGPKSANAQLKSTGLSPQQMAQRLGNDLINGAQGKGGYFLTGDLSKDLFREDCVFEDPTNRVDSLSQYQKALALLFDPERSTVELLGNGLQVTQQESGVTTITGRLRSRGYLKVAPWKPYVKAYETTIVYTLDPETGLVARQDQEWSKDASEALRETFTPSFNGEAPRSNREPTNQEPASVTALFAMVNGRRPKEYSAEERIEIDEKINEIVNLQQSNDQKDQPPGLAGKWVLVYLQPGPDGAGIDRRLAFFPEFDFNDSFQIFSSTESSSSSVNRVTNIGQVLGSLADVRVSGSLREIVEDAQSITSTSKRRFEATIEGGRLCFGANAGAEGANCPVDLPMIKGKGIFDSLYLGDRLRIGQNINGGGARVVQVRL